MEPELVSEYLGMIEDANECIKMYKAHILELESRLHAVRSELKEKDESLLLFMQTDPFSVSRNSLRSFFITVKNRRETDAEWELFQSTFTFKLQLEIYKWVDSLEQ